MVDWKILIIFVIKQLKSMSNDEYQQQQYWVILKSEDMKEIVCNINKTYTVKFEGWSVTANATELEYMYKQCYGKSILTYLRKAEDGK